jgi:hypothetical protein
LFGDPAYYGERAIQAIKAEAASVEREYRIPDALAEDRFSFAHLKRVFVPRFQCLREDHGAYFELQTLPKGNNCRLKQVLDDVHVCAALQGPRLLPSPPLVGKGLEPRRARGAT